MADKSGGENAELARAAEAALLREIRERAESVKDAEQLQMIASAYASVVANPAPEKRTGRVHSY